MKWNPSVKNKKIRQPFYKLKKQWLSKTIQEEEEEEEKDEVEEEEDVEDKEEKDEVEEEEDVEDKEEEEEIEGRISYQNMLLIQLQPW